MAKLGEKAEPILTVVKDGFNQLLQEVLKLTENVDFEALAEKIKGGFQYFIDTIIPAIKDGFQWILDNKDILIAGIVAIGTGMLAWNVVSIVQGVVGAIKTWTVATEGMTVAQRLLNLAMSANPIGLVVTAITALVAGFTVLWNTSDSFRQFWIDLWDKLKSAVGTVVDWIKANWESIVLFMMNPFAGLFKYLYDNFEGFRNTVDSVMSKIVQFFKDCWTNIKSAWSGVSTWFSDTSSKVSDAFKNIPSKIKEFFSNAWAKAKEAWSTVTTFFSDTKDKVIDAFVSLPADMLDVGKNLVEGLWNGVKDKTDWVIKKLKSFGDDVLGGIKKFFGIASPSKEMAEIGKFLDEGLAQGIEKNKKTVTKATDNMSNVVLGTVSGIKTEIQALNSLKLNASDNPFENWSHKQLNSENVVLIKQLGEVENGIANIGKAIASNLQKDGCKSTKTLQDKFMEFIDKSQSKLDTWKNGWGKVCSYMSEQFSKAGNTALSFIKKIGDYQEQVNQTQIEQLDYETKKFNETKNAELLKVQETNNAELLALQAKLNAGLISEEEYTLGKNALAQQYADYEK
jgi:phage-related protein